MDGEPREKSENEPRLIIAQMVLENFKSYYGKQIIGPFHKCFSAIVGPNGSGKSNVIDALLFVFGRRAKQLRESKVSELIHNSEKHQNIDTAKVSVHFTYIVDHPNGDGFDEIPNSELIVSRTAYSNNTSKYHVNGKTSTFSQVTEMLKKKGIDLDNNRFLILQGEVESIALKQPKGLTPNESGLLEYLEDIIGCNRYVEQIENASKEVDSLTEDRQEKLHRVKLVEKEKTNLSGAKEEAQEFLKLEDKILVNKSIVCQMKALQFEERAKKEQENLDIILTQIQTQKEKIKESQSSLQSLDVKIENQKKIHNEAEETMELKKKEFAVFEKKDVQIREQIKGMKKAEKSLHEKIRKETHSVSESAAQVEKYEKLIPSLETASNKLTVKLAEEENQLEKLFESVKEETGQYQKELEEKQTELEPFSSRVNELTAESDMAQNELDLLTEKGDLARANLEMAESSLSSAREKLPKMQKGMESNQEEKEKIALQLSEHQQELKKVDIELPGLTANVSTMRARLEEYKSENMVEQNRSEVLNALLKQKEKGQLPGIFGRLGDLGCIDSKYDVAISTACPALNNVVVDTRETGQRCVEFLKEQKLGRATFIMLDGIQYLGERVGQKSDSPAPRLFDLVKVQDDRLQTAFYFALRDTLVANDLDSATKIAYGKGKAWRVVTLNGELIDTSGTMSGGGSKKAKGLMGTKIAQVTAVSGASSSNNTLKELEQQLDKAVLELKTCRERKQKLGDEINTTKKKIKMLDTESKKLQVDIDSAQGKISDLLSELPSLVAAAERDPDTEAKAEELRKKIAGLKKELNSATKAAKSLEDSINKLKEKVLDIGGVKLRAQKFKVEQTTKEIEDNEKSLAKSKAQIKTAARALKKGEEKKKKLEGELEELQGSAEKLTIEFKTMENDALKVMEEYKKSQQIEEEAAEDLNEYQKELDGIVKVVSRLKAAEVDLLNRQEDLQKIIKDCTSNLKEWTRRFNALKKKREKAQGDSGWLLDGYFENEAPKSIDLEVDQLRVYDIVEVEAEISTIESKIQEMAPNMSAIEEYRKKEEAYLSRVSDLDSVTEKRDTARNVHDELKKKRYDEFMDGFVTIVMKLKEMYQMITLGGDAELELVDSLDPFSEGIVFSVRPPKKSWKNISNLSGGEKTLASLALVFALHHYRPTPLYVMDEIDAALDFRNVSIVANYIKERTKNAQFVIISLRQNMFELGDRLVGIYKTDNCTKSVTLNPQAVHL